MNFIKILIQTKKNNNQKGATAVEMAIVLLVFISIIFGIIEFGLLMYNQHIVTNASREGARYGIVMRQNRINENDIEQRVRTYADQYLVTFGNNTLDEVNVQNCQQSGDLLSVTVEYDYNFLFLRFLQRTITSSTRMICE